MDARDLLPSEKSALQRFQGGKSAFGFDQCVTSKAQSNDLWRCRVLWGLPELEEAVR